MNDQRTPLWVDQAKRLLDESARDLDAATLSRLNRARQSALELAKPQRARPWLLPTLASACALLLVVALWMPQHSADNALPTPTAAVGEVGMADANGDDASVEFYQNLEFYAWLDAQAKADKGGDNG